MNIKWRRSYTNGQEDYCYEEVAIDGCTLCYRDFNVDFPKKDDLEWKRSDEKSAEMIMGFVPTFTFIEAIKDEFINHQADLEEIDINKEY